ncbi:MAG TPA: class I SAM-dependent methyltransferase [Syntrophorhabdales bacterium]|nr:class I SAM-dependent methyltransferase [Syntrophorhabdales bacterium]
MANIDIRELFNGSLVDLGSTSGAEFEGIYSPVYKAEEVNRFMSEYYESPESALAQSQKFDMTGYYFDLLSDALQILKYQEPDKPLTILDIGCGFGSATFPLLDLFPNASVVASELSISMLSILRNKLHEKGLDRRCILMQLNAEELDFRTESFDFIVGAAILHHLFQPEKVCAHCFRILKPGGAAVFFEPFENGYALMGLIYREILARNAKMRIRGKLTRKQVGYFQSTGSYWRQMRSKEKAGPFFVGADDKWLFTEHYLQNLSEIYGFEKCVVFPAVKTKRPFETLAKVHFEGNGVGNLPNWVWEIINDYEDSFSDDLKMRLFTEAGIILKKA